MTESILGILYEATSIPSLLTLLTMLVGFTILFGLFEHLSPADTYSPIRRQGLTLDLVYWFFTPLITKILTNCVLAGLLIAGFLLQGRPLDATLLDGYGPLGRQPLWLQTLEILILGDFIDYWTHRGFHTSRYWRFHAIHHSSMQMNWLSASRMHPINDLITRICQVTPIVLIGFSAKGVILVVPMLVFYVLLLHSNVSWTFGPFRYLLVSPAYHRWHHTSDPEGIDKNFAGIFPIWDLLFGTYYFPAALPQKYGVHRDPVPESLIGQLMYPFRAPRDELSTEDREPVTPVTG